MADHYKRWQRPVPEEAPAAQLKGEPRCACGHVASNHRSGKACSTSSCDCFIFQRAEVAPAPSETARVWDYVAWCKYVHHPNGQTTIRTCDSDEDGAFQVYRRPELYQKFYCQDCGFTAELTEENIEKHRLILKCKGTTQGIKAAPYAQSRSTLVPSPDSQIAEEALRTAVRKFLAIKRQRECPHDAEWDYCDGCLYDWQLEVNTSRRELEEALAAIEKQRRGE